MSKSSLPRIDLLLIPFRGGDNEDIDEGNQNNGQQNDSGNSESSEEDDDDDDDLDGITDPNQRRIAELSKEAAKRRREKNAQKRRADALQAELDRINNSGGSEKQQWEAEKAQLEKQLEEMRTHTSNAVLRNAIQSQDSKYSWYDVPMVMGLLDRETLEIDLEEGSVEGLESELKRIAKEKPYLVKKGPAGSGSKPNGEGNGSGSGGTGTNGSTGSQPSGRNSSNDARAAQRATLISNYPALGKF